MSEAPKIWANYGDGTLHEMAWSREHESNISACKAHTGVPVRLFLEHQLPKDPAHCPYCLAGLDSPVAPKPNQSRVDNEVLRARFEATPGLTATVLAARAGYMAAKKEEGRIVGMAPDPRKIRRLLGISEPVKQIAREDALRLCDALDLDPVDVGL